MKIALHNIGQALTGRLEEPTLESDAIVVDDGRILSLDGSSAGGADLSIDCKGMTVAPGLIDTHIHPTLGDFGTKQQSVGYLERMLHGAVTRGMSAGEVHLPGRSDADSAVAIAVAAHLSFDSFQAAGMKVHGGGVLLEKDTEAHHIDQAHESGVRIVGEVGIGSLKDPHRSGELATYARELGMTVHMHCGGTSDRGPGGEAHPYFSADDVFIVKPSIASHANSFVSLSDEDIDLLCSDEDGPPFVEVVQAGGTRSMLRVVEGLAERDSLDRLLIGTDTPTGYGVASLGMLKTLADIASLTGVTPEVVWAIATGNATRAFGVDGNRLETGLPADLVVMDAALGSRVETASEALATGEWPGVALVMTDGVLRVNGSQCTLRSRRVAEIETAS